jgi:hypothetical protein
MLRPLAEVFAEMKDPRQAKGKRYELGLVLTLIFLAILSGEDGLRGIAAWLREQRWELGRRLGLRGGRVPSYGTVRQVLMQIDVDELEARLGQWAQEAMEQQGGEEWQGIAIDGKTLRGSRTDDAPGLHLLSAFSHQLEIVLGQRAVGDKTNEIPEIRELLERLTLEGMLVTVDAMHTQRETAELIAKKGGPT